MKVVLYHKNCTDGLFAGYVAWQRFWNDSIYIPVNYKPIQDMNPIEALNYLFNPDIQQDGYNAANSPFKLSDITPDKYKDIELYVLDYSFPIDHFIYHTEIFKQVVVLDHHAGAIETYSKHFELTVGKNEWLVANPTANSRLVFSSKESGAKLTYMYLFPDRNIPLHIEYVSDRDLWQFKHEKTRAFHAGINMLRTDSYYRLDLLVKYDMNKIIEVGELYETKIMNKINSLMHNTLKIDLVSNGVTYSCGIINADLELASDLCNTLIIKQELDIAIAYIINKNGKVTCSIRSREGVDLIPIVSVYGGGGHKRSAGFTTDLATLVSIINNKRLEV